MALALEADERTKILRGEHPEILRPHEDGCPFKVGEEIILRSQSTIAGPVPLISIRITAKHRKSPETWQAIYTVRDERGLYLGRGSGYTRSSSESIDPEAPVLDEAAEKAYAAQSRLAKAQDTGRQREALIQQQRALRSELAETLGDLEPTAAALLLAELQRNIKTAKASGGLEPSWQNSNG